MSRAATILLAILLLAAPVAAEDRESVLLLPLEGFAGEGGESVAAAAGDLLASAISAPGGPRLVTREDLDRILGEKTLGLAPADAARLVGATLAVAGTVSRHESTYRMTIRVIEVPSGATRDAHDVSGPDLAAVVTSVAQKLRGTLAAREPMSDLRPEPRAAASLHFLRGLGFHRAGLHLEAIGEFLEAKRLAVRFPETRFWSAGSWLAAGEPEHAAIEARAFLAMAPEHPLAEEAREIARRAVEAAASRPEPVVEIVPAYELAKVILASDELGLVWEEMKALDALGEEGVPVLAERWPELFLALVRRHYRNLRSSMRKRYLAEFDLPRSEALAGRLASASSEEREVASQVVLLVYRELDDEVRRRVRDLVLETARGGGVEASLGSVKLLSKLRDRAAATVLSERFHEDEIPDGWRIDAMRAVSEFALDEIGELLLPLLESDNEHLRREARLVFGRHPHSGELSERFRQSMWGLLQSRRYPREALDYSLYAPFDDREEVARVSALLLESSEPKERSAGFRLAAYLDPEAALALAWGLLDDEDEIVRSLALYHIGERDDPEETLERLAPMWEQFVRPEYEYVHAHHDPKAYFQAMKRLAHRSLRYRQHAPNFPEIRDGPGAVPKWFAFWRARAEAFAGCEARWEGAGPEEREDILVAMGATGHPGVLDFYNGLDPASKKALADAWKRAHAELHRRFGVPEDEIPVPAHILAWRIRVYDAWRR